MAVRKDRWNLPLAVKLSETSCEFRAVATIFRRGATGDKEVPHRHNFQIQRVVKIQNYTLWQRYCRKSREMCHRLGQPPYEAYLFHGTKPKNVDGICLSGFQTTRGWDCYSRVGCLGIASYFTWFVHTANFYSSELCRHCRKDMPYIVQSALPEQDLHRHHHHHHHHRPHCPHTLSPAPPRSPDPRSSSALGSSAPSSRGSGVSFGAAGPSPTAVPHGSPVSHDASLAGDPQPVGGPPAAPAPAPAPAQAPSPRVSSGPHPDSKTGLCYIILARVLVGMATTGPRSVRNPWLQQRGFRELGPCDATVCESQSDVAIFDDEQIYPAYVIEYRRPPPRCCARK